MGSLRTELQPVVGAVAKVRSVSLTPGRWIFVCPCGARYGVSLVVRHGGHHARYCFHCKQQNGRYIRAMDERLDFNENPNGKLNSPYFLLVRISNPVKHAVGLIKQIYLRGVWKGNAEVISVQQCTLGEITAQVSYLTAGLPPEALRRAIRTAYRKQGWIEWDTQTLDIVLLGYLKESIEPKFFE